MKKRYFYVLGIFTRASAKKINDIYIRIPEKFDHAGWDARSWKSTYTLKEVSHKDYKDIVIQENAIIKQKTEMGLKDVSHHRPMTLTVKQIDSMKLDGIRFIELN